MDAIQEEPVQSNEERALLAAENSGLELGAVDIPEWKCILSGYSCGSPRETDRTRGDSRGECHSRGARAEQ